MLGSGFDRLSVTMRIYLLAGFLLVLLSAVTGFGLLKMHSVGTAIGEVAETDLPILDELDMVVAQHLERQVKVERALRLAQELSAEPSAAREVDELAAEIGALGAKLTAEFDQVAATLTHALAQELSEASRQELGGLIPRLFEAIRGEERDLSGRMQELLTLAGRGELTRMGELGVGLARSSDDLKLKLEELFHEVNRFTDSWSPMRWWTRTPRSSGCWWEPASRSSSGCWAPGSSAAPSSGRCGR